MTAVARIQEQRGVGHQERFGWQGWRGLEGRPVELDQAMKCSTMIQSRFRFHGKMLSMARSGPLRSSAPMIRRLLLSLLALPLIVSAADTPPNIVMIISDDHLWSDYGFMGHAQLQTPNLDKLAGESLTFRRGYVTSSLCCPSLATIITGLYPHQHKVTSNDPPLTPGAGKKKGQAKGTGV
jgi:hypothetical protein